MVLEKAIAITFAKQGANVNILDSNFDAANSTVNEILKINVLQMHSNVMF